jgi:Mrp family chromosome partitioning ATPase
VELLAGSASLGEAIHPVSLRAFSGQVLERGRLDLLSAGPSARLGQPLADGEDIDELLAALALSHELVVIDTAPLDEAADGYTLLGRVDGVVVASRLGRARRDSAWELAEILKRSGARVLGVIANGARRRPRSPRREAPVGASLESSVPPAANGVTAAQEQALSSSH